MPPLDSLRVKVKFFYRPVDEPGNETTDQYWKRIGKKWNEDLDRFVSKRGALEAEVSRTVNPGDPPEVKLRKIYARVQQIRNLSDEDSKSKKEAKQENLKNVGNAEDVLKHGYGNGIQMNRVFIGMARAAGFQATEIYLTSRGTSFFLPQVRDASQLNGQIAWVRAGTQEYYADPASAKYPFGLLPWEETEARGVRVGKDSGEIVITPAPKSSETTSLRNADLTIQEDGSASGKVHIEYAGRAGARWRTSEMKADETGRRKAV
jgi:hypothetical protein